jgi:hypothetical protein
MFILGRPALARRKIALAVMVPAALLVAAVVIAAWYFAGVIAQPPWRKPDAQQHATSLAELMARTNGAPFEVRTTDGLRLAGLHLPARSQNNRAVIMVHGYGGNLLEYATQFKPWHDLGFDVFLYDQRASGASEGDVLTAGIRESDDLKQAVIAARAQMPAGAAVGVYGRSGGGATAVLFAGQGGSADFLVVDCAYSDFIDVLRFRLDHDYAVIPALLRPVLLQATVALVKLRFNVDLEQARPLVAAPAIRTPVMFVNTAVDTAVPPSMTLALHAAVTAPKSLHTYPLGGHGEAYMRQPEQFTEDLRQYLADTLASRAAAGTMSSRP